MKKLFLVFVLILCVVNFGITQTSDPKYNKWKTPSFFRGFNVLNESPKITQDLIDLRASGANLAQLGCFGFQDVDSPYTIKQNYIDETDSLVKYCRAAGVYYTIAVRQGPGRRDVYLESAGLAPKSTIWKNLNEQKLYGSMLKNIVQRYLPDTLFVGFNLFVEPNPLFNQPAYPPELFKSKLDSEGINLKNIYSLLIDSVRTVSPDLPLIIQNVSYSSAEYFSILEPQSDPYVIYEFHSYRPQAYTKETTPNSYTYPGMYFSIEYFSNMYHNKAFFENTIYEFVKLMHDSTRAPFFMGEFGLLKQQNGGIQFLTDISDIALEHGWHFALWEWRRGDGTWNYELMGADYWNAVKNSFVKTAVSVEDEPIVVNDFELNVYPNPFNPSTQIEYNLPERSFVQIKIYDLVGRELANIDLGEKSNGKHKMELNILSFGRQFSSGPYFLKLEVVNISTQQSLSKIKKLLYLK